MDIAQLAPFAIFTAISIGVYALVSAFTAEKSRADQRLEEIKDPRKRAKGLQDVDEEGVKGMFKKAAPALSKALQPKSDLEESNLKVRLANAGFSSPTAPTFFLAIKFCGPGDRTDGGRGIRRRLVRTDTKRTDGPGLRRRDRVLHSRTRADSHAIQPDGAGLPRTTRRAGFAGRLCGVGDLVWMPPCEKSPRK